MLPKSDRLKDKNLFSRAFNKKQVVRSDLLSIYYLYEKKEKKEKSLNPKTAFIVSTKIDKRATARNLIKRRMKASYNVFKKPIHLFIDDNYNYSVSVLILIANTKIKDIKYTEIKKTIKSLLNKLELKGLNSTNSKNRFPQRKNVNNQTKK